MAQVRAARPEDLPALYDICLKTGDAGADATALHADPRILGEIYAAPYARLEPNLALVAEDEAGVCGYILGTADTRAFEARCEAAWWPALRTRYADTAGVPWRERTPDEWAAFMIHHPPIAPEAAVAAAVAHLHIDLLPRAQGQGLGRTLMDRWLDLVGGRAHLGCSPRNVRALAFYDRYGFRRLEAAASSEVVYMAIE